MSLRTEWYARHRQPVLSSAVRGVLCREKPRGSGAREMASMIRQAVREVRIGIPGEWQWQQSMFCCGFWTPLPQVAALLDWLMGTHPRH